MIGNISKVFYCSEYPFKRVHCFYDGSVELLQLEIVLPQFRFVSFLPEVSWYQSADLHVQKYSIKLFFSSLVECIFYMYFDIFSLRVCNFYSFYSYFVIAYNLKMIFQSEHIFPGVDIYHYFSHVPSYYIYIWSWNCYYCQSIDNLFVGWILLLILVVLKILHSLQNSCYLSAAFQVFCVSTIVSCMSPTNLRRIY